ncbi:MAG: asparagine synthase-related protein [Planctomycetota bacterium]
MQRPIHELVDLIPPSTQRLLGTSMEAVRAAMRAGDLAAVRRVRGSFALAARDGERVFLARSLDRPLRYFLAKQESGPLLLVADRIDAIQHRLHERGLADQFRPDYTRMAPAHHVTELRLVGCPDPNPTHRRFLEPAATLPQDLDEIGHRYVAALADALRSWLAAQDPNEPIGVPFSGGIDSGAVLLALHDLLLQTGQSAARLKAFTLSVDGAGADAAQALDFLGRVGLEYLSEVVEVDAATLDPHDAVAVIEDYKARDVECATAGLALLREVRNRYPAWSLLVDGDGGDENLKDYPIEENPELTIRSVVQNSMLYQEGWGVECIKHSQTYSGGYSRGCVRTFAPAAHLGFAAFSPFTQPDVVAAAAAIPFAPLAEGSTDRLYRLKGEIVRRGMAAVFGRADFPVFPKRRFQEGATAIPTFDRLFAGGEAVYRRHFAALHS